MTDNATPNPVSMGVGIDTARYSHHVSFLDEQKRTAAQPFHFTETAQGYQKLLRTFEKLQGKHPRLYLHIRIDAAGQYAENLLQWLHQLDFATTISVGQPARNKAFHMSRKGNDLVRRFLYPAAQSAAKWNPPVKALFTRLMATGKSYNVAIGHCMGKLLRQVFALWTKDCDFDPQFEAQESPGSSASKVEVVEPPQAGQNQTAAGHKNAAVPQTKVVTATTSNIPSSISGNNPPPLNFARLREQVSIQTVLEQIGWAPQQTRGAQWRGPCPLHESLEATSRCFAVETEQHMYCCHRCGSGGNALDLWTAFREKPLLEAAWDLVNVLRLEPPLLKEEPSEANR